MSGNGLIAAVLIGDIAVKVGILTPEVIFYISVAVIAKKRVKMGKFHPFFTCKPFFCVV